MSRTPNAPDKITVEFLDSSLASIHLIDLGPDFLHANGIDNVTPDRPFKVAVERKTSKAGNAYYEYSQNGVPLPTGLATFLRVEGAVVPFGKARPSKSGHPTKEGMTEIVVGGVLYKVIAYLTEGKTPFYVKVVAHKKPSTPDESLRKAQMSPRGGEIIL
ncbi:MAG: hypothetical protein U0167_00630 [bacterium]